MVDHSSEASFEVSSELAQALGKPGAELAFLGALDKAAQAKLVSDIQQARQQHRDNIEQSLADALNYIPRLLRGPIKKLFGI